MVLDFWSMKASKSETSSFVLLQLSLSHSIWGETDLPLVTFAAIQVWVVALLGMQTNMLAGRTNIQLRT